MDSTTARQRRGTAKPSMKKNALRVLLARPQGAQLAREPPPPRCAGFISLQIAIFLLVRFRGGPTFACF